MNHQAASIMATDSSAPGNDKSTMHTLQHQVNVTTFNVTEFRQPLQVQSHLEMPGILVQLGHIQRT